MEDFVKILVLENEIEAQLLNSLLTEQEIPHLIKSYHDSAYDGIYQALKGWGRLDAPERYKAEILDIYQNIATESQEE
jgi:hypothetical protein